MKYSVVGLTVMLLAFSATMASACPLSANVSVQAVVPTAVVSPLFATTTAVAVPLAVTLEQDSCFVARQAQRLEVLSTGANVAVKAVNRRPIRAFLRPSRTRVRVLVR